MATEIAALGLKVEAQGVDGANKALDKLVEVAARAEKAVSGLEAAAGAANKKAADLDKGASAAATSTKELDSAARGAAKSTQDLDKSAGGAAKATDALDKGASGAGKSTTSMGAGVDKATKSTKELGAGADKATASVDEMGKKARTTEGGVNAFAATAVKAGAALAAAFSVSAIARYADSWSDMQSKVGAATKDMAGAAGMMTRLVDIANASYSPLSQTVDVYARNVTVLREMGRSSSEAADYVESLNNMLVLTATRGERASSVQDALSKAMATGKLEADGLETVLANGGEVAAALARELNTTTSGLRSVASQGKITGKVISEAVISSLDDVRTRAAEMPATITDAFVILGNNVTEFVGRLDKASGASSAISGVIIEFAGWLRKAGDYALAFGALLAPAFDKVGTVLGVIADNAALVGIGLAGFYGPAVIGGIATLVTALTTGVLGAVKAITAAMLANPLGLLVAGLAAAGYAAYKFRDEIKQAVGVDVVSVAKGAANTIIGSFAAAYEDVKFVWSNFGDMMGAAVIGGVNLAIRSINSLIQGAISGVNTLVNAINNIPGVDIKNIGSSVGISELNNPYSDRLSGAVAQRNAAIKAATSRDYVGDISGWLDGIGKGGAGAGGSGGGGSGGGAGAGGKSKATVSIEAETDAIKRALADQVGALEAAMEKNEYLYSLGIRNAEDYYLRQEYLGRETGLAAAKAAEKEIEVVNKALASNKLTEDQRKKLLEDRRKLIGDVGAATVKAFAAEGAAQEAAARKRISLQQDMTKSAQAASRSAAEQAASLATEVEQYGMTASAIAKANVARASEDLAIAQTTRAMAVMRGERAEDIALMDQEIDAIKNRALALRSIAGSTARLEILEKNKELTDEAKKQNEQIGESLTDALLRGFESGKGFAQNFKDTMVNLFKTMVLKPIIQPIAMGAAGLVTGALGVSSANGNSGSGLSGVGSAISSGASALSNATGIASLGNFGGGFSSGLSSFGNLGATMGNLEAGMVALKAGNVAGGLGSLAGTAAPYIGAAMTAYQLLSGMFKGEKRSGGTFQWQDGQSQFLHGPSGGTAGQSGAVNAAISATAGGINSLLRGVGSALSVTNLIAGFEGSEKGRGGVMSGVTLSNGARIGEDGTGSNYSGTYYNKNLPTTLTTEAAAQLLTTDLKQLQIEVLQSADDIPNALRKLVDGVDAVSLSDEAVTALLGQITAQVSAVEGFRAMVDSIGGPLEKFKVLTYDLTVAFVDASGGLEAAQNNLASFYQGYYSESERMADTLSSMTPVFEQLGFAVPATRAEFRSLVDGLSLTDETAVRARATLLGLNETFGQWADYSAEQTEANRVLSATFAQLALVLPQLAQVSGEAQQALVSAAGGLSNFTSQLKSYQEGYYTEQERAQSSLLTMAASFKDLGFALPESRQALRQMIESQDLSTESGRKLYTALIGLSQGFGTLVDSANTTTNSLAIAGRDWAKGVADNAMTVLVNAINTRKNDLAIAFEKIATGLRESITTVEGNVNRLRSASTALTNTLRGMMGVIDPVMERDRARSLISAAAAGGPLPSQSELEAALGIVAQPAADLFSSFEDYMLDFLGTANDIDRLQKLTGGQLTLEEQALETLKKNLELEQKRYDDEIKGLDKQLEIQQLALQEAMGTKVATLSVKDAVTEMNASIVILAAKMAEVAKPAAVAGASLSSNEQAIYNAYKSSGLDTLDAEGWAFWNAAAKNGKPIEQIVADIIKINGQKVNGSHANGLDRVPFNGYRAELHEGERIKTRAQADAEDMERARQASSTRSAQENEANRIAQQILAKLMDISSETRAIAQTNGNMSRLMDRWDGDGVPPTRDEMV